MCTTAIDGLCEETVGTGAPSPLYVGPYREVYLRRVEEVAPLMDEVAAVLAGLGHSPGECMGVRLALEEAVVNGLRHGNGGDPAKRVRVRCYLSRRGVLAEV